MNLQVAERGSQALSAPETQGAALKVFISYSRADLAVADAMVEALERNGFTVTIDRRDLPYGEEWQAELATFIAESDTIVWLVSPDSVKSRWCNWELGEVGRLSKRLVPVRIRDIDPVALPESLGKIHLLPVERAYVPSVHEADLVRTLNTDRAWLKQATRLGERAREWGAKNRDSALLLRGAALSEAETWSVRKPRAVPAPTSEILELILASRRAQASRRRFAIAAVGVLLAAAAVAGWQIESDRRDKLRLEETQQRTDRDRRTLAAVNDAARARELLARGDVDGATALALGSLVTDSSLPFIPQAYAVLYSAHFLGSEPRNLDLASYDRMRDLHVFELDGGRYLTASEREVAVWSPTAGVSYVRNDVQHGSFNRKPAAAADAVFLRTTFSELRYWPADGTWDEIDYSSLSFEALDPRVQVAIDHKSLIGCNGKTLFGISIPEKGSGEAEIDWRERLDSDCQVLALGPEGSVLVGGGSGGVVQIDLETRAELMRYSTEHSFLGVQQIDLTDTGFAAVEFDRMWVFRFGQEAAVASMEGFGTQISHISQSGRFAIEAPRGRTDPNFIVHDLEDGTAAPIRCLCTFQGFSADNRVLTLENDRTAALRDAATGDIVVQLHTFESRVDNVRLLSGDKVLLGLRKHGAETVVPISVSGGSRSIVNPGDRLDMLSSVEFVDDSTVAAVYIRRIDGESLKGRTDLLVLRRSEGGAGDLVWSLEDFGGGAYGYGSASVLGHGLIGLSVPDGMIETEGTFTLVDMTDGGEVWSAHVNSATARSESSRFLALDVDDDLVVYDLAARRVIPMELSDLDTPMFRNWEMVGNRFTAADGAMIVTRWFGQEPDGEAHRIDTGGKIHHLCLADENTAFAVVESEHESYLGRWSVAAGERTAHMVIDFSNEAVVETLASMIFTDRRTRRDLVSCAEGALTVRDLEGRVLVWQVTGDELVLAGNEAEDSVPASRAEPLPDTEPIDLAWLARGRVAVDGTTVVLFDEAGVLLRRFGSKGSRAISAALIPGRGWVAAGFENGSLEVWDANTPGAPLISVIAHGRPVEHLAVNDAGTALISADIRATMRSWPLLDVEELRALYTRDEAAGTP